MTNTIPRILILLFLIWPTGLLSKTESQSPQTVWKLEPDAESKRSAYLILNMTEEAVLEALGEPDVKHKKKKNPKADTVWIYKRKINGPIRMDTVKTPNGYLSVRQPSRFIDQVRIGFLEGRLCSVSIKRREETPSEKGVFRR